jgi:hypothetical protein
MNQVSLEINRKGAFQVKSQSHEPSPQKELLGCEQIWGIAHPPRGHPVCWVEFLTKQSSA